MGQSMGMLDFFVLEAGEYLERLDALTRTPAGPFAAADEFVRIVRAWRGGALMASQQPMARAAQGLEAAGRALKEGRLAWDERVRGEITHAIDDCKTQLRRIRTPDPGDAGRAEEIGAALERLAGRPSGGARVTGGGLDAGGRAFVAREAAAIASTLDRAARGLSADRASRDALGAVGPTMSALRGVAVLNDLPPLADLLAAVDGALKEVFASPGPVGPMVPTVFDAAAKALARAAREVVDVGRPTVDSAQASAFAAALLTAFAGTEEIPPIDDLFYEDAGPHIVHEGTAPAPLSRVELVSQGEFLERVADDLARAPSPIVRDLKLFGMAATLRPLAGCAGSPVSNALGRLAEAGRAAIDRGAAGGDIPAFSEAVADAAQALRTVETGTEGSIADQLDAAADRLDDLTAPERPAAPAARPRTTRVVPELAAMPAHAVPAEAGEERDLAGSFASMERIIAQRGLPLGSLEELLTAPTPSAPPPLEEPGVVPIESLMPDEMGETSVPIESLLYRGQNALRRALELKEEVARLAASPGKNTARLYDLQREVFDLVELGLSA